MWVAQKWAGICFQKRFLQNVIVDHTLRNPCANPCPDSFTTHVTQQKPVDEALAAQGVLHVIADRCWATQSCKHRDLEMSTWVTPRCATHTLLFRITNFHHVVNKFRICSCADTSLASASQNESNLSINRTIKEAARRSRC